VANKKAEAKAATRTALLESAQRLVLASPAADPIGALKPVEIVRRADPPRTTGAFYNIWPTFRDFRDDLLQHLLAPERLTVGPATTVMVQGLSNAEDMPLAEVVRVVANLNFDGLPHDVALLLKQALWSRHRTEPRVRELLAGLYDGVGDMMEPMYEGLLSAAGRRMRTPYTVELLAVVLAALEEGLHLRWAVDPQAVPEFGSEVDPEGQDRRWTTFAAVTHMIILGMTEDVGDTEDAGDRALPAWST